VIGLNFEDWEPVYNEILEDFGYSREMDELAAGILANLAPKENLCNEKFLSDLIGDRVIVAGNSNKLKDHLKRYSPRETLIAADGATTACLASGFIPDIIVTDLDGEVEYQIKSNSMGSLAVIHAHGDNIDKIISEVPKFTGKIVITTQSRPYGHLYNWGGFTDGDRAVMMAAHFGATSIDLIGFDFERPAFKKGRNVSIKRKKLGWAKKIIHELVPDGVKITLWH